MTDIWKQDLFLNTNIPFVFNKKIYEYDMKDAGFSLTKEFDLIDFNTIEKLEKYKKDKRKIELGLLQKNNDKYKNDLKIAFSEARRFFFEKNNLDINDIISIKKDAIFTIKKCDYNLIGKYIDFRVKNEYTSYINLNKKFEFYYKNEKVDVKGLSEENYNLHKDYMIKFISQFFNKMETTSNEDVLDFTKRFIDKYKRKELEVGYYRSFDFKSSFIDKDNIEFLDFWEDRKEELNITFNYFNILLKLIQIPL